MVFRFLLGVTEAANWPAGLRVLARTLPPGERTLGCGVFDSGAAVGALIAPVAIFALLGAFGWRSVFFCLGLLGFLRAPIWLLVTRRPELSAVWTGTRTESVGIKGFLSVYRGLCWQSTVLVGTGGGGYGESCFYFTVNWLPTYFVQARKLVPGTHLGGMLTVIFLALDIGNIGGGAVHPLVDAAQLFH